MTTTVVTPTLRRSASRSLFWILAAAFLVVIAIIGLAIGGAGSSGGVALSATNAAPTGSKAIAEVLRQQGVQVRTPTGFGAASTAAPRSTLVLYDPNGFLSSGRLKRIAESANHLVLVSPTFAQLTALAPGVNNAGDSGRSVLSSDCALPAVVKAGSVTGTGHSFRLAANPPDASTCLASGKNSYSLIELHRGIRTITVLGTTAALTNEHVGERGNAALALNLLGDNHTLVWYLPTALDSTTAGPSIAELTPLWVSPVLVLLVIVTIVAALWRGRRFGPLVIENLPVTVRASETMEGRARLYQRGGARLHALDALRIGAISRIAAQCGLTSHATLDEIVRRVADLTATDPPVVRSLLVDDIPGRDADLVRLSDALLRLERQVAAAINPG